MRRVGLIIVLTATLGLLLVGEGWGTLSKSISFSPEDLTFSQQEGYDLVNLEGCNSFTTEPGAPSLPAKTLSFLIPQDAQVDSVRIVGSYSQEVSGDYWIYPVQYPVSLDGGEPLPFVEPDPWYYFSGLPYPWKLVEVIGDGYRAGYHIVSLKLYPLRYNGIDSTLTLYTQISFQLKLSAAPNGALPVYRRSQFSQREVERYIRSLIENPEDMEGYAGIPAKMEKRDRLRKPKITPLPSLESDCVDEVIISSEELKDSFQRLADWRTKEGVVTELRTTEWIGSHYPGVDPQEKVHNFIRDCYSYWGTMWVLLGGDTDVLPYRGLSSSRDPSDLYFSGLDESWNSNGNAVFGDGAGEMQLGMGFYSVDFVNPQEGWAVGDNGTILHTSDGGKVWMAQESGTDKRLDGVSFVNPNQGWILVEDGTILHTSDGGENWVVQPTGKEDESSKGGVGCGCICFVDTLKGWAVGCWEEKVLVTKDGGNNWSYQAEGMSDLLSGITFIDSLHGWAVGKYYGKAGAVLHTEDGGQDWQRTPVDVKGTLYEVHFADRSNGWANTASRVIHTSDGGGSWEVQDTEPGPGELFIDLCAIDSLECWLVGYGGLILHTQDGGLSWVRQDGVPDREFLGLSFPNSLQGWVVGGGGIILHTADGGESWETQFDLYRPGDRLDLDPDVWLGRAPAEDTTQVNVFINKILTYEKNPPTDYLKKILLLGGSIVDSGGYGPRTKEAIQDPEYSPWYPLVGLTKWELYGPKDDPISWPPPHPLWTGDAELNRTNALAAINSGYHFINHGDHAGKYCLCTGAETGGGKIWRTDADDLTNGSKLSILYSFGCSPNAFDYDCFSEHFINNPNGGGVAFIGNTRISYVSSWDENDPNWQDLQFYQSLFGDSLYFLGQAFATTQDVALVSGHDPYLVYIMNMLGEPAMPVWTDTPSELMVSHPSSIGLGPTQFTVTTDCPGALVCLQKGKEAYAVGLTGDNGQITFDYKPDTPGTLSVTVTAQNRYPYEGTCTVGSSPEAYVYVCSTYTEAMRPGESVQLVISLCNSGQNPAQLVSATLSSADSGLVDITSDYGWFGDIPSGGSRNNLSQPFILTLSPDWPDSLPWASFQVEIQEGHYLYTWEDEFRVAVRSDSLVLTGNWLTVGEDSLQVTVDSLLVHNYGWGDADSVVAVLRPLNSGITVTDSLSSFGSIGALSAKLSRDPFSFTVSNLDSMDFTLVLRDRYGRQWLEEIHFSTLLPPYAVWASLFGQDFVDLGWGYQNLAEPVAGYNLYRSPSRDGEFVKVNPFPIRFCCYRDQGLAPATLYYYKVTAIDSSGDESGPTELIEVETNPSFLPDWPQPIATEGENRSSVVAGNLDGDSTQEVVVASRNEVYAWKADGSLMDGWPKVLTYTTRSSPALADLDGDGKLDVVISGEGNDSVYVWNGEGENLHGWPQSTPRSASGVPAVSDIDGDGSLEVLIGGGDSKLYAWHSDGSQVDGFPVELAGNPAGVAIGDVDPDSPGLELAISCYEPDGHIYLLSSGGGIIWGNSIDSYCKAPPVLGDLDGDGSLEVVVSGWLNGKIGVWKANGDPFPGWPIQVGGQIYNSPALGDIDGNPSTLEIAVGYYGSGWGRLSCLDYQGNTLFEKSIGMNYASPVIADVDGDEGAEVLISCGRAHPFHAFKVNGDEPLGWPIQLGGGSWSSPALADLEGDGDLDILLGCTDGKLYGWDLPCIYDPDKIEWGMYQHDYWHTGLYTSRKHYFSGHISKGITWEGELYITGDVTIDSGAILTIQAGTDVIFMPNQDNQKGGVDTSRCEFIVEGNMSALGTASQPVSFASTSSGPGSWYGIRVKNQGWVVMENVTIKDGYCGVDFDSAQGGHITSCTIKHNQFYGIKACAVDDLTIASNTIYGNNAYGVYTQDCSPYIMGNNFPNPNQNCAIKVVGNSPEKQAVISGNTIAMPVLECDIPREGDTTATTGIYIEDASAQIVDNHIGGGYYGILGIGLDSTTVIKGSSEQKLDKNVVGLALYTGSRPIVSGNHIDSCRSIGVACYQSCPLLGDSLIPGTGNNSITPGSCSPQYAVYCEGVTDTIKAEMNFWGGSPPDPAWFYGPVDYDPWLTSVGVEPTTKPSLPDHFSLSQNYPNPFNPTTIINYELRIENSPIHTTLKIYNILGREVRTLVDEPQAPGYYSVRWNGRDNAGKELASGVYFYRIKAGNFVKTKKMVLLR